MHARSIHIIGCASLEGILRIIIPDRVDLGEHVKNIETESVNPFVEPVIQNADDLFPELQNQILSCI